MRQPEDAFSHRNTHKKTDVHTQAYTQTLCFSMCMRTNTHKRTKSHTNTCWPPNPLTSDCVSLAVSEQEWRWSEINVSFNYLLIWKSLYFTFYLYHWLFIYVVIHTLLYIINVCWCYSLINSFFMLYFLLNNNVLLIVLLSCKNMIITIMFTIL